MPPFLAFRLWLREGPRGERMATAFAAALVVAVSVAALVPVAEGSSGANTLAGGAGGPSASSTTGPGAGPGAAGGPGNGGASAPGATGAGASGVAPGSAAANGSSGGSAAFGNTNSSACGALSASATGVTSTSVLLDMANLSLAGPVGNSTFHVRPDLKQIAAALAADINQHGGVACGRKLVLKQYDVNPLDANDSQSKCLQMAADHPFMVFNFGAYLTPATRQCFVQAKVLEQSGSQIDQTEARSSYPYMFSAPAVAEQGIDAAIFGLASRGFFAAPKFKKIGLFEDGCDPPVNKQIAADLAKVGVKSSQISTYVLDCNVASPPNQIEQGVIQHKLAHATHVFLASSETNDQNYVRIANGQNFHPTWLVSDYGSNTSGAGTTNWDSSFNGAVAITTSRVGELSSGIHNPQEVACDKALRSHGVKGIQSENDDTSAMDYCDMFWLMRQALNRAGANPTQLSFMQALATMGLFHSVQLGDGNFHQAGKVTGGDYERELQFRSSCTCWRIVDKTMRAIQ